MTDFKGDKSIFQQIADGIEDRILKGDLISDTKIPSVRDHAAQVGVNQNTILRTYSELQREGIIENKRGIGYFVKTDAIERIREKRKQLFFDSILPQFIHQVEILGIEHSDLTELWKTFEKKSKESSNE